MSRRATTAARVLAGVLLAMLAVADAAHADRFDEAARALREPGVWVDRDLSWLVGPAEARRLDRRIAAADVPVRVAVLPQVEKDESRGDQRAIARAIIRRVDRDGLYVLVDQEGDVDYAARDLPLKVSEFSFRTSQEFGGGPFRDQLAGLVPTLQAAAPAAPPVSFEPFSNPKGISLGGKVERDSLVMIALVCAFLGAVLGIGLHFVVRGVAGAAAALRGQRGA
jgi:hypothetical protein